MSVKNRGFASASKAKRKELSSKGGKKAHALKKAHQWTSEEASNAANKGVENRKRKQAQVAAINLIQNHGFDPGEIAAAGLSYDDFIYYGGARSTIEKIAELRRRV